MLNAWISSVKQVAAKNHDKTATVSDDMVLESLNIDDDVNDKVDRVTNQLPDISAYKTANPPKSVTDTLTELEQQQKERLDVLISNLLERQMKVLEGIVTQTTSSHSTSNKLPAAGLQELLINGELVGPAEAVKRRKQSIEKYLHDLSAEPALDLSGESE